MVEGAEFLLTHRDISRRHVLHLLASAACGLLSTWLFSAVRPLVPPPGAISLPWYLVLVEWSWSNLPAVLAAEAAAASAAIAYLLLARPRALVLSVVTRRGGTVACSSPRASGSVIGVLTAGGLGCIGLVTVPWGGAAASVLWLPLLGAGLVAAVLSVLGWPSAAILTFLRSRIAMLAGLGLAIVTSLAVPVVNLVALPCATVGAACLILREEGAAAKTSGGTIPYVSRDR